MHDKIAQTAEHAFIGSLQKILGQTLRVRKVEHKESGNTVFITMPHLKDPDIVFKAASEVNSLISMGRKVTRRRFTNLEEAKKKIPHLRANEERISGEVRVVEIEDHDAAACAMEHSDNLRECDFFLVTRLSRSGDEYEVDFSVGKTAKLDAVTFLARFLRVCSELGANFNTVENTVKRLKEENEANRARLRALSKAILRTTEPQTRGKITLFKGIFSNLADEPLKEFAGENISNENAVVLLANIGADMANIIFARNEKLEEIDCNAIFKRVAAPYGSGGGKPHFVTGVVRKDSINP